MKIYADSLFLLNFTIDYLLLLATGRVCSLHLGRGRMLLGAAWGGLYALLCLLRPELFSLWTVKPAAGAAAVLLAYGGQGREGRSILTFFALSAAFGGAVYAVLGLRDYGGGGIFVPVSGKVLVLSFALCYPAISFVFRRAGRQAERSPVTARVELLGRSVELAALKDTGNGLRDPISGDGVIILEKEAAEKLLGRELEGAGAELFTELCRLPRMAGRLRLLSFSSLGGSGLLLCMRADRVELAGREEKLLVGIAPGKLSPKGDYNAIY